MKYLRKHYQAPVAHTLTAIASTLLLETAALAENFHVVQVEEIGGKTHYEAMDDAEHDKLKEEMALDKKLLPEAYSTVKDQWKTEQKDLAKDDRRYKRRQFPFQKPSSPEVKILRTTRTRPDAEEKVKQYREKAKLKEDRAAAALRKRLDHMSDMSRERYDTEQADTDECMARMLEALQTAKEEYLATEQERLAEEKKDNVQKTVVKLKRGKRLGELGFGSIDRTSSSLADRSRLLSNPNRMVDTRMDKLRQQQQQQAKEDDVVTSQD